MRRTLVATMVSMVLFVAMATPADRVTGAWGNMRDLSGAEQTTTTNNVGKILGAPFRALGKLFGRGKKNKAASKITEKDMQKFEASQVTRVKDAQTPSVKAAETQSVQDAQTSAVITTPAEESSVDHLRKGRELLNAGQLNEAIAELTKAAANNPKSGEAHTLLGVAYDRKGLGGRAREEFQTALHDPDDQAMHLNNLGYLLYRQGEFDDAIKYLKRAAKLNPGDVRIMNNLTTTQLAAGKFDDAYKSSVVVLGEFESRLRIAKHLEWRGYLKEAIKYLEKARALQPRATAPLSQLAALYASTGETRKAEAVRESLAVLQTVATVPAKN
jgi:Flp pilus assembly protein TadD